MSTAPITSHWLQDRLQTYFPGAEITVTHTLNGSNARVRVWEFEIALTLIDRKLSFQDVPGQVMIRFVQVPDERKGSRELLRETLTTMDPAEIEAYLQHAKAWMMGVAHAILSGMKKRPGPKPMEGLDGLFDE